jgi:hypothetical protein
MPRTTTTGSRMVGQPPSYAQLNQHRPATAWSFPLPPQGSPKPQANPACQLY